MNAGRYLHCVAVALLAAASSSSALAQVQAPPLEAYGDLPAVEEMAMSPSGNLAILGKVNGERMVLVLDSAMKPHNAIKIGNIKVRGIAWAGDEELLVTRSDTVELDERFTARKTEIFNVMIVPMDNAKPAAAVFADKRTMVKAIFGDYGMRQVNGHWLGYFGGIEMPDGAEGRLEYQGGPASLYAIDVSSNEPKRVARPGVGGISRDWLIGDDGKVAATLDWQDNDGGWTLVNQQGKQIASGVQPDGNANLVAFGRDGVTAIYSERKANDDPRWFEVPLDGSKAATEILADTAVDVVFFAPGTSRMIGYRPDDASDAIVFFDSSRQAELEKINKAFAGVNPRLVDWNADFTKLVLRTSGNNDSGTFFVLDTATRQSKQIGVERPQIGPVVGPISTVSYKAADGTEIDGILTLPPGRPGKNLPVVLLPHGGPHAHDNPTFDWWAQAFASRGYAVFQPNFRGSTDRDRTFREASYGQWGRKMQTDLSDGLAELVRLGIADPKRACIMGASYGGYAALAGVTLQQDIYRCAVSVAGVSDLKLMYDTDLFESNRDRFLKKNLKEELGDPGKLDEVSPRFAAARAAAPILLIHGRDDTVVPFRHSQIMADALKDAGKPYEMVQLKLEDHWLSRPETRIQMLSAAMDFMLKHNPPD